MSSSMQALFFDIDDTLYNQLEPYEQAFEAVFGGKIRLDISDLFRRSRKHSDISYQLLLEGKISYERMFIYRIQKALESLVFMLTMRPAWSFSAGMRNTRGIFMYRKQ